MDARDLRDLCRRQRGVVSRRQLLDIGAKDSEIRRLVRRRQLARVYPGVYVDHTGPLTWEQRAWAGVLYCAPAALAGASALDAHGLRGHHIPDGPISVCVEENRFLAVPPGIRVIRIRGFNVRCQLNLSPPRMRLEHALVMEAARRRRPDAALAVLGDAVQTGRTTPARLAAVLDGQTRSRHRRLLKEVLDDVAAGAYSALERRYLVDVERPHGLPVADRQRRVRVGRSIAYRDVDYLELGTAVELDGRLGHEDSSDRWADLDRDLDTVFVGGVTLRVGWKQVLEPCRLAAIVGGVLVARGWTGSPRQCGPGCGLHNADAA